MKKYIFCLFCLFLLLAFDPVRAAQEIDTENKACLGGYLYEIKSHGSKIENIKTDISTEHLQHNSILPSKWYEMQDYLKKNNINFSANNASFGKDFTNYQAFMNLYGDVYNQYGLDETEYKFVASAMGMRCTKHGDGSYSSCPTSDSMRTYNSVTLMSYMQNLSEHFDAGTGKFKLIFDGYKLPASVKVRVVRNGQATNSEQWDLQTLLNKGYGGEVLTLEARDGNDLEILYGQGEKITLEFYLGDSMGECSGAYFASVKENAPSIAYIDNPLVKDQNSSGYKACVNYKKNTSIPDGLKSALVPECYNSKIDYFSYGSTLSNLQNKIDQTIAKFTKSSSEGHSSTFNRLQCELDASLNHSKSESNVFTMTVPGVDGGNYWAAVCTETATVTYDTPKKLKAGGAFPYTGTLTVTRTCTPIMLRKPEKLPKCNYRVSCWYGPANHFDDPGAGPNEEFDSCVQSCDGGKYSQSCINQCYAKVYEGKDVDLAFKTSSFTEVITAKQMAQDQNLCSQRNAPNYCSKNAVWQAGYCAKADSNCSNGVPYGKTEVGGVIAGPARQNNAGCSQSTVRNDIKDCVSEHGITYEYWDACNSDINPTKCYEVFDGLTKPECSDNPEADYNPEAFQKEYEALMEAISIYETSDQAAITITDSYKPNGKANLKTTFTSQEGGKLIMTLDKLQDDSTNNTRVTSQTEKTAAKKISSGSVEQYQNSNGQTTSIAIDNVEVSKTYSVQLPQAFMNNITQVERYANPGDKPNASAGEYFAGNRYFTDLNSSVINKWSDSMYEDTQIWENTSNYAHDDNLRTNNIFLQFTKVGTSQGSSKYTWDNVDIDCFYGIILDSICVGICDPIQCDENNVCTGGTPYTYRQVDPAAMFNRPARWNWTYAYTDKFGVTHSPEEVINRTEETANSIYSTDTLLDYDITITKENIKNIRKVNNKKNNTYQTYDMDCVEKDGQLECTSNLLRNQNYVSNFVKNR